MRTYSPSPEEVASAAAYESLHVPALFGEWVDPVLDAGSVGAGHRVLDVACGTGVLARGALERVGDSGSVVGVDPAPGMLAVAEREAPEVDWRIGAAEALPFPDGSFDRVTSQFGMMFFEDRRRAVEEMLRVLGREGRLAVAVWDSLERTPAYATEVALLERIAGSAAAEALAAPFVLGDRNRLVELFEESGVAAVEATTRTGSARFPDVRVMVEADLRGWLPIMGVELPEETIEEILVESERALAGFVAADGSVVFDSPAHIVSGGKA